MWNLVREVKEGGTESGKYSAKRHRHNTLNTIRASMHQEISAGIDEERTPCQSVYESTLPLRDGPNADPAWRQRFLVNPDSGYFQG